MANFKRNFKRWLIRILVSPYSLLDGVYLFVDRRLIRRTANIPLIPCECNRRGGKYAYSEWAYVIGIFQTLIFLNLSEKEDNLILDIGCGTGLLGIAAQPFLGQQGRYVGLDVMKKDIDFCRKNYPAANFDFIHFDVNNPAYAPEQKGSCVNWPVETGRFDLVTALSVWTHLKEEDALFYFKELDRVLRPGGKAIITFFILDEIYDKSGGTRSGKKGRFHMTPQDRWIFDLPAYGSEDWRCPGWASTPESAIGVTAAGLERLLAETGLELQVQYPGNWKEVPGVYFQDVLVFQKT